MFNNIKEIMIDKDLSVKNALNIINLSGIGFAIVADEAGRLTGTVTDGDIRRTIINGTSTSVPIKDIMSTKPYFAEEGTENRELLSMLKIYRIKQLPIVNCNKEVVSVVWLDDLIKKVKLEVIPLSVPDIGELEAEYIKKSIESSWISTAGANIKQFENELSDFLRVRETVALNSGTSALHTALLSIGVKEGCEVIIPGLSFIATANVVKYCGAEPVFCDIDKDTWNIDPTEIEKLINTKTRAVIIVHLLGNPAKAYEIKKICEKHGVYLIEDAAQSMGSTIKGNHCGTIGDIGCFSFNGNKIITTGGGGALVSNSQKILDNIRKISNQGRSESDINKYDIIGYNYKMTNIHAAIGLAQLKRIKKFIKRRITINQLYIDRLKNIAGLRFQKILPECVSNHWITGVYVDEEVFGMDSDNLNKKLNENNVLSKKLYLPLINQPIYKQYKSLSSNKNIMDVSKNTILLPSSNDLEEIDLDYITNLIRHISL